MSGPLEDPEGAADDHMRGALESDEEEAAADRDASLVDARRPIMSFTPEEIETAERKAIERLRDFDRDFWARQRAKRR